MEISSHCLEDDPKVARIWRQLGRPRGCYATGGWVRDRLLGRPTKDLDLSIEGSPETVERAVRSLAAAAGSRPHLLGREPRAVWRLAVGSLEVEVWPLGGLDREADARRRDLTVNALAWRLPGGPLEDHVGGLADLDARRLRAVARANLEDDPVRLLRVLRFVAQLESFELDETTATWVGELAGHLRDAPRERVGAELLRLLQGPAVARSLDAAGGLGVLEAVAPAEAERPLALAAAAEAADRLARPARHPVSAAVRSAGDAAHLALVAWAWRPATDLGGYAWPREAREPALAAAAAVADLTPAVAAPPARRRELIHPLGDAFPAGLALAAALTPDARWARWWRQWCRSGPVLVATRPLLASADVCRIAGIAPGPELGHWLSEMVHAQVRGEVRTPGGARRWLRGQLAASAAAGSGATGSSRAGSDRS